MLTPFLWLSMLSSLASASFIIVPTGSTLAQCSQVDLIWTEEPPIRLWAAPDREISAGDPVLESFGVINTTFLLWTVNLPVGQNVSFTYVQISKLTRDVLASPQAYTVVAGSSDACMNSNQSSSTSFSATSIISSFATGATQGTQGSTQSSSTSSSMTSSIPSSAAKNATQGVTSNAQGSKSKTTLIAGVIVGVFVPVALFLVCLGFCLYIRGRRQASGIRPPESSIPFRVRDEFQETTQLSSNLPGIADVSAGVPSVILVSPPLTSANIPDIPASFASTTVSSVMHASEDVRIALRDRDAGRVSYNNMPPLPPAYEDIFPNTSLDNSIQVVEFSC